MGPQHSALKWKTAGKPEGTPVTWLWRSSGTWDRDRPPGSPWAWTQAWDISVLQGRYPISGEGSDHERCMRWPWEPMATFRVCFCPSSFAHPEQKIQRLTLRPPAPKNDCPQLHKANVCLGNATSAVLLGCTED